MTYQLNSKYPIIPLQFYPTPMECIKPMVELIETSYDPRRIKIWEPCVGDGSLSKEFKAAGADVYSSDISNYGYEFQDEVKDIYDYENIPANCNVIITNPPFGREAPKLINHCLKLAMKSPDNVDIWMLLRHTWDTASTRMHLLKSIDEKHIMCWRPRWIPGTTTSGQHNFAWYKFNTIPKSHTKTYYITKT